MAAVAEGEFLSEADALHAANKPEALFDFFKGADTSDVEIAWRACRAHHDLAEELLKEPDRREQLLRDGLALAEATLKASPESGPTLKWYAILLGRLGDFLPTKEKVAK